MPTACTLAIIDKKQKLVNSRKPNAPVLMERSTVFKTPTRCSSFGNITSVPSSTRTPRTRQFNAHTPMSARKTPGDRFIPSRAGTDLQYSAHKVRCGRRSGKAAENHPAQDNARTPLVPDPDSARRNEVKERLLSIRGRSSESRVLNFKPTPTGCTQEQRSSEFSLLCILKIRAACG